MITRNDELTWAMTIYVTRLLHLLEEYNADSGSECLRDRGTMLCLELRDLIAEAQP